MKVRMRVCENSWDAEVVICLKSTNAWYL